MNKFEQVSSDDHQISVAGGGWVGTQVSGPGMGWGEVPCHVTYPMMYLILTTPPPSHPGNRQLPMKILPSPNFVIKSVKKL